MTGSQTNASDSPNHDDNFSLTNVRDAFAKLSKEKTQIETVPFLEAFKEMSKLLDALGLAPLKFVRDDIKVKITYIEDLVKQHESKLGAGEENPYKRLNDMLQWEVTHNCLEKKTSGGWNLVRLRRALDFLINFLEQMAQADSTTATAAFNAYQKTLSAIHPWAVRQLVSIAVYALPSKETFMSRLHIKDSEEASRGINEVLADMKPILASVYELYDDYNLNHLK
eukprot:TRINITY_DN2366_c0_g1_i1.p1 TRINITY_DN2366_c0_g1~~TRINITY_DN2366_c0_g1_i1.p1  ORF type:complete len:225 (+),score=48.06 TRINITY_DN2366_c0_g1_i1:253-927(+)